MKDNIKNKLNILKEGADVVTIADYQRVSAIIINDSNQYSKDTYMNDDNAGDGIYEVKVFPKGTFEVRQTKRASFIGMPRELNNRWYFYVRAYCSRNDDQCEGEKSYGPSAASDAATKVRVIYGKQILEFVKTNIPGEDAYTSDEKGADISKEKTLDKWAYKFDKYTKAQDVAKRQPLKSLDDDEKELRGKLKDVMMARIEAQRNRDRAQVKSLKNIETQIKAQIENLGKDSNDDDLQEAYWGAKNKRVKSLERRLSESMTLSIQDFPYGDDLDTIGSITHFLKRKLWYELLNKQMSDEEKEEFKENGMGMDVFAADGSDYFEETGIMNFYTKGLSSEWIKKIVSFTKYILNEEDVRIGNVGGEEESGSYRSKVIRIPIIQNDSENNNPPEINLSNSNARYIFKEILDFDTEDDINVGDILVKIDSAMRELPTKNIDGATKKDGNVYKMRYSEEDVMNRLKQIKDFAIWAKQNGYNTLYIA